MILGIEYYGIQIDVVGFQVAKDDDGDQRLSAVLLVRKRGANSSPLLAKRRRLFSARPAGVAVL